MEPFKCWNCLSIKCFNLAANKQDMASQKFPHTFPIVVNTYTDKLCTAATVHFLLAK